MSANSTGLEIAVIGMSCRFPGAVTIQEFWANLVGGKESIHFINKKELEESGIESEVVNNPHFVNCGGGKLHNKEYFDASFFGFTPNEAELIDPQIRLFLECTWEALETGGYSPFKFDGSIGLYGGASSNYDWQYRNQNSGRIGELGVFAAEQLVNKDFLCTRVSHKLDLKGPAITIQTACSTSLVAIHTASRALLTGECDMALAGGVSVKVKNNSGYVYREGMVLSRDGHCRAFDKDSSGMVPGEGCGVVLLKKLKNALRDRDDIWGVIKSTSINNDGLKKVGYSAPSVAGQKNVITTAQRIGKIEPESITYVEAHGTGTSLGDPIEIEALRQAFNTDKKQFCAIGSVKTNIGHLDVAAGVASFIKTVLMLRHKQLVPSLHFKTPNPQIDFSNTPFYVNTENKDWQFNDKPLRAAVSSFGIGGTNAHVILEEAPMVEDEHDCRDYDILPISAKTPTALSDVRENLKSYILNNPNKALASCAYTLQTGRGSFRYRQAFVCRNISEAGDLLSSAAEVQISAKLENKHVVFMFPGQGTQYMNMGADLYKKERYFRERMDECFEMLSAHSDIDFKTHLYGEKDGHTGLHETSITQPLIFSIEFALAKLLMHWGIKPDAMIGHSIGEYVAACLAGVFSIEQAIQLVLQRGRLMQLAPKGSMVSISARAENVQRFLHEELSLALINSNQTCVLSGSFQAVDTLIVQLEQEKILYKKLQTSHAFHSHLMEPILDEFETALTRASFSEPKIPFISNVSGTWISTQEATSPQYWKNHIRKTVNFSDGINHLLNLDNPIFLEVGPGKSLSMLATHNRGVNDHVTVLNLMRHQNEQIDDALLLGKKIAQLWADGVDIDWNAYHEERKPKKIALPTYPFQREYFWVDLKDERTESRALAQKNNDRESWFYAPRWVQAIHPPTQSDMDADEDRWLILAYPEVGLTIEKVLKKKTNAVVTILPGTEFKTFGDQKYTIDPTNEEHYKRLFQLLIERRHLPNKIIHLWSFESSHDKKILSINEKRLDAIQDSGLTSLLNLARQTESLILNKEVRIIVVTNNQQPVLGNENINPFVSSVIGAVKVIPLEFQNIHCKNLDISDEDKDNIEAKILEEFNYSFKDKLVALRGSRRWLQEYIPIQLNENSVNPFVDGAAYLITGGLGGIGYTLAKHLAQTYKAKLVITGRTGLAIEKDLKRFLTDKDSNVVSDRALKLKELEKYGSQVLYYQVDVSDLPGMKAAISKAEKVFGRIRGVLHAAGLPDYGGVILNRTKQQTDAVASPKIKGVWVLSQVLDVNKLDFFINCSSLATQLFHLGAGQVGYIAGNEVLDSFAHYCRHLYQHTKIKTINWNQWKEVGMAAEHLVKSARGHESSQNKNDISPAQGIEILYKSLSSSHPQLAVSFYDIEASKSNIRPSADTHVKPTKEDSKKLARSNVKERPALEESYAPPATSIEKAICNVYQVFFGYDKIGIHDDFYELGGDSLKAILLVSNLQKTLNVPISLNTFLNANTVHKLALLIAPEQMKKEVSIQFKNSFFNGKGMKLFGSLYEPEKEKSQKCIIVSAPFFYEQINSQVAYQRLITELASETYSIFYFDFYGCGDSFGSLETASLNIWHSNIDSAIELVKHTYSYKETYVLGLRLSASLCLHFGNDPRINGIIAWHPILNGSQYIEESKSVHKHWMTGTFNRAKVTHKGGGFEYMGYFIPEALSNEIKEFDAYSYLKSLKSKTLLIHADSMSIGKRLNGTKTQKEITLIDKQDSDFWMKHEDKSLEKLVPEKEIAVIKKWIGQP